LHEDRSRYESSDGAFAFRLLKLIHPPDQLTLEFPQTIFAVAYDLELGLLPLLRWTDRLLDGRHVHKYILPAALR